ncbi:MAG: hypothetical protein VX642_02335 [Bdellovibrionota bacterium]|nr:hypothetical protein [Bdellovibrionota bacterium]
MTSTTSIDLCVQASAVFVDNSTTTNIVVKSNFTESCSSSSSSSVALGSSDYIEVYQNGSLLGNSVESSLGSGDSTVYTYGYNIDGSPGDTVTLKYYFSGELVESAEIEIPSSLSFSSLTNSFSINANNVFSITEIPADVTSARIASSVYDSGDSFVFGEVGSFSSASLSFSYSTSNQSLITSTGDCNVLLISENSSYTFLRFQSGSYLTSSNQLSLTGSISP